MSLTASLIISCTKITFKILKLDNMHQRYYQFNFGPFFHSSYSNWSTYLKVSIKLVIIITNTDDHLLKIIHLPEYFIF
jgi:hypothetical protein